MFVLSRVQKILLAGTVIMAILGGAWFYYTYTQNQIQVYRTNAALAEQAVQDTKAALEQQQKDLEDLRTQFEETSRRFDEAAQRVSVLEEKLSDHDLGFLAQSRPALVENIIDKATQDVLRCFEIVSGSPLTEEEKNATRPSEINGSCSDIANPNYRP